MNIFGVFEKHFMNIKKENLFGNRFVKRINFTIILDFYKKSENMDKDMVNIQ